MTDDSKKAIKTFVLDEGKKWAARTFFLLVGAMALMLLTPIGERVKDIWNSPEVMQEMLREMKDTNATLRVLTGENRVTQQPDDMSYVKEPVFVGDTVDLVLFIGRTEVGAACALKEIIPQFTDENNVTFTANPRRPRVQLPANVERRIVSIQPPHQLVPGRTRLQLQLEYRCGGETVFELTKPVFYYAQDLKDQENVIPSRQ